ncbi:putative cyclase [Auriculariales sp. MPI-PUGE-AT-0066]|nr:putative cyclase [Auriculariales sp. MPI-PUGE-AT-0066]
MSRIIVDLSHPLDDSTVTYPGDPVHYSCCNAEGKGFSLERNEGANLHSLSIGTHTGTHIDAPGTSCLMIVRSRQQVEWHDLQPFHDHIARAGATKSALVLRTGWSKHWNSLSEYRAHPFLSGDCALQIVAAGIRVIGLDTFSPDETPLPDGPLTAADAHVALLGAGIPIAENLRLDDLDGVWTQEDDDAGRWTISLLPLRLTALDGSPIRAVAWRG